VAVSAPAIQLACQIFNIASRAAAAPQSIQPQILVFSLAPIRHRFIFWIRHNEGVRLDGSHFLTGCCGQDALDSDADQLRNPIFPSVCFVSERHVS
ncbi:hypothetical protein, partial [Bradyrhizobium liaoningense]